MTTVSFAQPEIRDRVTGLMTRRQHQIIARFLSEPIVFEGCSSAQELGVILDAYDMHSEYPEGSGWSYTRFFLPEAYKGGFRLAAYEAALWQTLAAAVGPHGSAGIPMEHICLSVEYLLLAARSEDCLNFLISDDEIREAVDASNLALFSGLMHGYELQ